jgi:hypothetical protein
MKSLVPATYRAPQSMQQSAWLRFLCRAWSLNIIGGAQMLQTGPACVCEQNPSTLAGEVGWRWGREARLQVLAHKSTASTSPAYAEQPPL